MSQPQIQVQPLVVHLTEDEFFEQFKPIKNTLDDNASYEGTMFETFGEELEEVKKTLATKPLHVWTIADCEDNHFISEGYHFVDRIGYFITEIPAQPDTQYIIAPEEFDVIMVGDAQMIYEIDMTDIFRYDTPEEVSEWSWLETHASYKHTGNGHAGIWEFMLNMANEFIDVPTKLEKYIKEAKSKNIAYLLFHQGT